MRAQHVLSYHLIYVPCLAPDLGVALYTYEDFKIKEMRISVQDEMNAIARIISSISNTMTEKMELLLSI